MGVPLKIIHFNRMFPYKPSIFGYLHLWKPPNGSHVSESQPIFFLISQPCTHNPLPCFKMPENLGTPQEKHINPAFYLTGHRVTNHNIYVIQTHHKTTTQASPKMLQHLSTTRWEHQFEVGLVSPHCLQLYGYTCHKPNSYWSYVYQLRKAAIVRITQIPMFSLVKPVFLTNLANINHPSNHLFFMVKSPIVLVKSPFFHGEKHHFSMLKSPF